MEMGWPKDQEDTPSSCNNNTASQQHSERSDRQKETILREWQNVVLPTLLRSDNGLGLTFPNISQPMPYLEPGPYGSSVRFSDYGQPALHVQPAPRYYPNQHRSWSPSRFMEAEIHHHPHPRRPAPEQPGTQGPQHISSPSQERKLHLPKLQVPDKDF